MTNLPSSQSAMSPYMALKKRTRMMRRKADEKVGIHGSLPVRRFWSLTRPASRLGGGALGLAGLALAKRSCCAAGTLSISTRPRGKRRLASPDSRGMDELSNSSSASYANSWISWFLASKGNEYFCEVDDEYIVDRFNLTSLNSEVLNYSQALELITDTSGSFYVETAQLTFQATRTSTTSSETSSRPLPGICTASFTPASSSLRAGSPKWYATIPPCAAIPLPSAMDCTGAHAALGRGCSRRRTIERTMLFSRVSPLEAFARRQTLAVDFSRLRSGQWQRRRPVRDQGFSNRPFPARIRPRHRQCRME